MEYGEDLGQFQSALSKINSRTVRRAVPSTSKMSFSKGRCETVILKRSVANSLAGEFDDFSPNNNTVL